MKAFFLDYNSPLCLGGPLVGGTPKLNHQDQGRTIMVKSTQIDYDEALAELNTNWRREFLRTGTVRLIVADMAVVMSITKFEEELQAAIAAAGFQAVKDGDCVVDILHPDCDED